MLSDSAKFWQQHIQKNMQRNYIYYPLLGLSVGTNSPSLLSAVNKTLVLRTWLSNCQALTSTASCGSWWTDSRQVSTNGKLHRSTNTRVVSHRYPRPLKLDDGLLKATAHYDVRFFCAITIIIFFTKWCKMPKG